MKRIQTALIGYGLSGRVFHGPLLKVHQGFEIKAIVTRDPVKVAAAQEDFPDAEILAEETALFTDPELDLVVICTPNVQHFPLAKQALEAGKHVVVEKPFTVTAEEAEILVELAEAKNLSLAVYQNRRYDGDFKTVQQILHSGDLGRLVAFESHFDRYRPEPKTHSWREEALPGSGILYDLGSHLIDQTLCLFGMPDSLYADMAAERLGAVDDAFEVILYYPDLKVTLKASALIKEPTPRFALYGTQGAYVKYGLDPQEDALRNGKLPNSPKWGMESEADWGYLNAENGREKLPTLPGSYIDFYEGVYQALVSGAPLPISGRDGLAVIRLIEAAQLSYQSRAQVDLSAYL